MYNADLERLIELCLADGVLTEKEKEVICKKAEAQGISPDEIMVYAQGLLDERNARKRPEKQGKVKLCPNCGAHLPSMVASCPDCGYELRDTALSDSVKEFSRKYNEASSNEQRAAIVDNFQIPTNKEDILEFMAIAMPLVKKNRKLPISLLIGIALIAGLIVAIITTKCSRSISLGFSAGIFIVFIIAPFSIALSYNKGAEIYKAWKAKLANLFFKADILKTDDTAFAQKVKAVKEEHERYNNFKKISIIAAYSLVAILFIISIVTANQVSEQDDIDHAKIEQLISAGKYREADALQIKTLPSGSQNEADQEYYSFLEKCIIHMCQEGQYDEAQLFMESKIKHFHKKTWLNKDYKIHYGDARRSLQKIINTYKNSSR